MYRIGLLLPLILAGLLAGLAAYGTPLPTIAGTTWITQAFHGSGLGLALMLFLNDLVAGAAILFLGRVALFHPGKRYAWWQSAERYVAAIGATVLAGGILYGKAALAGTQARALALQTGKSAGALLAASQAPHAVLEMLAMGVALSLPLFWFFRGIGTGSFRRATFEGWAKARRLIWVGTALLFLAAIIQVYVSPRIAEWALK